MNSDSNRTRLAICEEVSIGVLPGTPRFRTMRYTGESLKHAPSFFTSDEIVADRMNGDPALINFAETGGINFDFSFPLGATALANLYESAYFNSWTSAPFRDNGGTADSQITDIGTVTDTVSFLTGTAIAARHLVRHTGFANAANNGTFLATTGGATSYVATGSGWVAEAGPPGTARIKVVGLKAAPGDVVAVTGGLTSTTLDFTAYGLMAGQWVKIGGAATGSNFATAANNKFARISSITPHALGLDNLPSGWAADTGAGKSINIYFGDVIRNGTTMISFSAERGFLGQTVPGYILQKGLVVNTMTLAVATGKAITGTVDVMGLTGSTGTTAAGTTYDAATAETIMTGNASVGAVNVGGATITSPNWMSTFNLSIGNNLRAINPLFTVGAVDMGTGSVDVTGTLESFFGDTTLYQSLFTGTPALIAARATLGNRGMVWTVPRATFTDGSPNAGGKNQDITLPLSFTGSRDTATQCSVQADRFEFWDG